MRALGFRKRRRGACERRSESSSSKSLQFHQNGPRFEGRQMRVRCRLWDAQTATTDAQRESAVT
eukprot:6177717-Pleurochrysis_carterae.AAC.2